MIERFLDDPMCRLLITDVRFLTRFPILNNYRDQLRTADSALTAGDCMSCRNVVKQADIFASVRSRVNSMSSLDKRDIIGLLGVDKLTIPLGSINKIIARQPAG